MSLKRVLKLPWATCSPRSSYHGPSAVSASRSIAGFARTSRPHGSMLGTGARVRQHVVGAQLDRLLAEHDSCAHNHGHALWTLITLELFLRRHDW